MAFSFTINGHTYTSDPTNTVVPAAYHFDGYHYIQALGNLAVDFVAVVASALSDAAASAAASAGSATNADAARIAAEAAQAAAEAAADAAQGFISTSVTNLTIDMDPKTLTVQTLELYRNGQFVTIASTADPQNYIYGQVDAYDQNTGILNVNPVSTNGAGTFADWDISLAGIRGAPGLQGLPGVASPYLLAYIAAHG